MSPSKVSQRDTAENAPSIPFRKLHNEGFFQENEFTDIYAPIVGPYAAIVYGALCRNSYGKSTVEYSVRDLASGICPASAARAIQILEKVGLIKRLPTSGNRKSVSQLFDVKALAKSHGATRPPNSVHFELPAPTLEKLKAQVKAVRQSQQGKTKAQPVSTGKRNVEIAAQSGFHSVFSVSQRDASVSHLIRTRVARETQTGTHLIQEEVRSKENPTPTPLQNDSGEAKEDKDSPDEDEPAGLLKWAEAQLTGVMNDLRTGLFETNRPPGSVPCQRRCGLEKVWV